MKMSQVESAIHTVLEFKDAITQFRQDFFHKSPHAHIEIKQIFGLGMQCVLRWRYEWVDTAGKKGHVRRVDVFQMRNGLIGEQVYYVKR